MVGARGSLTAQLKAYEDEKKKDLSIIKNGTPVSDANRKALYDGMANAESQPAKGPAVTIDSGGISNNKLSNYSFDKQRGDESKHPIDKSGVGNNKLSNSNVKNARRYGIYVHNQPTKNARRYNENEINTYEPHEQKIKLGKISTWLGGSKNILKSPNVDVSGGLENYAATGDDKPIMVNGVPYIDRFSRPESEGESSEVKVKTGSRDFLSQYGTAKGANGKEIMVNGVPYIDIFSGPDPEIVNDDITEDSTPESDAYAFAGIEAQIKDISEMLANANNEEKIYLEEMLERYEAQYERMLALLEQKYGALKDMLTSERSAAEQRAAINFSKLMKYLPEQLRSQGLGGLGTSQSIFLKAYNMYNNQLAAAQNAYLSGMQEGADSFNDSAVALENQYSANTQNARSDYRSAVNANKQFYGSQAANLNNLLLNYKINQESADKLRNENDQNSNYTYAANRLATADFDTVEEVKSFINEMRGKMSDAQYELIVKDADRLIADIKTVKEDEALRLVVSDSIKFNKNAVADWNNDTFTVMMNGDKVKLDAESIVYDTELSKVAKELETNTLFGYDGELYFKNSDGNVVKIAVGKKDYNRVHGELYGK